MSSINCTNRCICMICIESTTSCKLTQDRFNCVYCIDNNDVQIEWEYECFADDIDMISFKYIKECNKFKEDWIKVLRKKKG